MDNSVIGDNVEITFPSLGNSKITGKVDTGASISCIHATNIQVDKNKQSVTFNSEPLSQNTITMDLDGSQDVLSADGGADTRPMIKLDIVVNNTKLPGMSFNLNDRSEMDSPILIGQNVIKSGNFIIDINQEEQPEIHEDIIDSQPIVDEPIIESSRENEIIEAVRILRKNNVSIFELVEHLRTAPLYLR